MRLLYLFFFACLLANPTFLAAQVPANDDCENATPLVCDVPPINGTTNMTVADPSPFGCASPLGVWYTIPGDGNDITITCDAAIGFDHELEIFSTDGGCDGAFTQLDCRDTGFSGDIETFSFRSVPGTQYYVYVAHFSPTNTTATGDFTIGITCVAPPPPPGE